MSFLYDWWNNTAKQEKFVQFVVFLFVFGYSTDISGAMLGWPMGLAWLYIVYDCIKKRSLAGFYMPRKYWLGIAVFLGSVVLASVLLGDKPSIQMAGQYVYWALPFPILFYLGKQADIKYAALLGVIVSVLASAGNMAYMDYLLKQGQKLKTVLPGGRIGAFDRHPNVYSLLAIGVLPVLLASFKDVGLRSHIGSRILQLVAAIAGLWSLWVANSRGAILGMVVGAIFVLWATHYCNSAWKAVFSLVLVIVLAYSGVAISGFMMGGHGYDNTARLRAMKFTYNMWKDHKLLGVGLANWRKEYMTHYVDKEEVREAAHQYYINLKKKTGGKYSATEDAIMQEVALIEELDFRTPHNVTIWFFSTTGILGGAGYLFFLLSYIYLLLQKAKEFPDEWLLAAGLWLFLAISFHSIVDVGIIYKGAARLQYIMLGITLSYAYTRQTADRF
jgi:O-antigen ligase